MSEGRPWAIAKLRAGKGGQTKAVSLSVEAPYCATAALELFDRAEVEALIADLRRAADDLWPGTLI